MTMIPSETLIRMVNQERERDEKKAAWARAAEIARQCCEASVGLIERALRAVGFRRSASCEG